MVQAIALFAAGLAIASPPAEEEAPATAENFVVVGRVLTADGDRPMEGVRVWASTGMGSLGVSGETKTDADGRFRLDFPGQGVAIVGVEKPGWHGRPHGSRPQYLLSQRPLDPKEVAEKYTNLVAGQPTPVEFRMEPAAQLKGHLIGPDGKPMANARLWLTGEALRLGGSVIADTKTDAEGRFAVQDVPRSPY
ncbi:MAG: carboxypeptidase-like regulatory domain-containing protein [Isosphaeraceae bacterium]